MVEITKEDAVKIAFNLVIDYLEKKMEEKPGRELADTINYLDEQRELL